MNTAADGWEREDEQQLKQYFEQERMSSIQVLLRINSRKLVESATGNTTEWSCTGIQATGGFFELRLIEPGRKTAWEALQPGDICVVGGVCSINPTTSPVPLTIYDPWFEYAPDDIKVLATRWLAHEQRMDELYG